MDSKQKMLHKASDIRGQILQGVTEIETYFDLYIAKHFTADKQKQKELIILLLAPNVILMRKFEIFEYLVNTYNSEFKKAIPQYKNDLVSIIEDRNVFAHYPIDFSREAVELFEKEETITFVKLKNSKAAKALVNDDYLKGTVKLMTQYAVNLHKLVYGTDTTFPPA